MGKSQSWSLDIIIGAFVFITAFILFYNILGSQKESKIDEMQKEGALISKLLLTENSAVGIVTKNELNESKLSNLMKKDYKDIKKEIGVSSDFCIYFKDDKGNLIKINESYGTGSKIINITKNPCNESI